MANGTSIFLKSLTASPSSVPNDGTGRVGVSVVVFSAAEGATITEVSAQIDLPASNPRPMEPDPREFLTSSGEGLYRLSLPVPLLTDPGEYTVTVRATDSAGAAAEVTAPLVVSYRRPDYAGGPLAAGNPELLARLSGAELRDGNLVRSLSSGADALRARMEMIESARRQINLQTYALDADGNCGKLIEAIRRQAAAGVEVNVILNLDSQLAVSARAALQLSLDRMGRDLRELVRSVDQALASRALLRELSAGILEALGPETAGPGLNLILADDQAILGEPEEEIRRRPVWLEKMSAEPRPKNGDERRNQRGFRGPGGLPSLPLLSYAVHEKILVVDGRRAIVGGRNLEDRYFSHWLDRDVYLEGPVAADVQRGFGRSFRDLARNLGRPGEIGKLPPDLARRGDTRAIFIQSRPWLQEYHTLRYLVTAFQMAQRHIYISSQYLVLPDSLLRDALLDAAGRGVEVVILTNSYATIQEVGIAAGYFISLHYLEPLLAAGIRIFEINGPEHDGQPLPYLHSKEFLIDGELAAIGSFNLSIRSCYIESENLVVVLDPEFAAAEEKLFLELVRGRATEITPDYLDRQRQTFRSKISLARYLELLY
jgi:phosphatidylserine/phosphatidylglycerophosphate/cardiolipin synthase-like enzyme